MTLWRIAVAGTLACLSLGGCAGTVGGNEEDRIEDAIHEQLGKQFASTPDPPTATGVESVECRPREDEFFRDSQVFVCEVVASDQSVYGPFCAARVEGELYFSGGKVSCEDEFSVRF